MKKNQKSLYLSELTAGNTPEESEIFRERRSESHEVRGKVEGIDATQMQNAGMNAECREQNAELWAGQASQ